ncbi:hypothetical protein V8D89_006567 [Ganoderma adspersum]
MSSSPSAEVTSLNDPPVYLDPAIGDLVIRSSDDIDFHVHQDILTHTSPSLSTMLALPKTASGRSVDAVSGKPLIRVQEDSTVWAHLVPLIYVPRPPIPPLDASQLDLIRAILDAARKYDIPSVTECMRGVLKSPAIVKAKPVSVYAVACAYELEDVARIAARQSLSEPLGADYVEELDLISIRTFHKLSAYRSQCIAAALREMNAWHNYYNLDPSTPGKMMWPGYRNMNQLTPGYDCKLCSKVERDGYQIRLSWATYMEKLERSLERTPDATKARSSSSLQPVITSAQKCHPCLKGIHHSAEVVSSSLEQTVKKAIDKVVLEF